MDSTSVSDGEDSRVHYPRSTVAISRKGPLIVRRLQPAPILLSVLSAALVGACGGTNTPTAPSTGGGSPSTLTATLAMTVSPLISSTTSALGGGSTTIQQRFGVGVTGTANFDGFVEIDCTLVELNQMPSPTSNVFYAGWDAPATDSLQIGRAHV